MFLFVFVNQNKLIFIIFANVMELMLINYNSSLQSSNFQLCSNISKFIQMNLISIQNKQEIIALHWNDEYSSIKKYSNG
jgi:hypothetical protein